MYKNLILLNLILFNLMFQYKLFSFKKKFNSLNYDQSIENEHSNQIHLKQNYAKSINEYHCNLDDLEIFPVYRLLFYSNNLYIFLKTKIVRIKITKMNSNYKKFLFSQAYKIDYRGRMIRSTVLDYEITIRLKHSINNQMIIENYKETRNLNDFIIDSLLNFEFYPGERQEIKIIKQIRDKSKSNITLLIIDNKTEKLKNIFEFYYEKDEFNYKTNLEITKMRFESNTKFIDSNASYNLHFIDLITLSNVSFELINFFELDDKKNLYFRTFRFDNLKMSHTQITLSSLFNCHIKFTDSKQVKGIYFNVINEYFYIFIDRYYIKLKNLPKSNEVESKEREDLVENGFNISNRLYNKGIDLKFRNSNDLTKIKFNHFDKWFKKLGTTVYFQFIDEIFDLSFDDDGEIELYQGIINEFIILNFDLIEQCNGDQFKINDYIYCFQNYNYYLIGYARTVQDFDPDNYDKRLYSIKQIFSNISFQYGGQEEKLELVFDYKNNQFVMMTNKNLYIIDHSLLTINQSTKEIKLSIKSKDDLKLIHKKRNCFFESNCESIKKAKENYYLFLLFLTLLPLLIFLFLINCLNLNLDKFLEQRFYSSKNSLQSIVFFTKSSLSRIKQVKSSQIERDENRELSNLDSQKFKRMN